MNKIDAIEEALDRLYEKLEDLNRKDGEITDSCAEYYRILLHGIKSGETVLAMKGDEWEYSRDSGHSNARKRNRMGRYSREDGYSYHDTGSLKRKLRELMDESPDEYRQLMEQLDK